MEGKETKNRRKENGIKKRKQFIRDTQKKPCSYKNMIFRMENARRTAIAEELGLTLPTITTSVNEMLTEGILEEIPITEGQLVNNMGRRPKMQSHSALRLRMPSEWNLVHMQPGRSYEFKR